MGQPDDRGLVTLDTGRSIEVATPIYVGTPKNQEPPKSPPCECNNCPTCGRPR